MAVFRTAEPTLVNYSKVTFLATLRKCRTVIVDFSQTRILDDYSYLNTGLSSYPLLSSANVT